jgi:hypothetical protein
LVPKVWIVNAHRDGQWFGQHPDEKGDRVFGTGISDSRRERQKLSFLHREPP